MIKVFIVSFIAVFFVAILFKAPKKAILLSAFVGAFGSLLFTIVSGFVEYQMISYFAATFFIAVLSEVLARLKKMPAIIFTVPAILTIVPGAKLYTAMANVFLGTGDAPGAVKEALLAVFGMAMAMVLTSLLAKTIHRFISLLLSKTKSPIK